MQAYVIPRGSRHKLFTGHLIRSVSASRSKFLGPPYQGNLLLTNQGVEANARYRSLERDAQRLI